MCETETETERDRQRYSKTKTWATVLGEKHRVGFFVESFTGTYLL